ncbi:EAL domain-containing protein [bacterium]|nr:EAL domain-containing protein [bacterium]
MGNLSFAKAKESQNQINKPLFKVLIVDDDEAMHAITVSALKSMVFKDYTLDVLHAYSGKEAKDILGKQSDIAMALVDVVMETPNAGLDLIEYIRTVLKNDLIRLIIRTGQPNEAPQMSVIDKYDINGYKEKAELTLEKLYTVFRTSIKQYEQLLELKQKYEETYKKMVTHSLTQLPNRRKLIEDLDVDSDSDSVLLLVDIVAFSSINEANGFEAGDEVLIQFGVFLLSSYGDRYQIYHLDADKFAILIPAKQENGIIDVVSKIKQSLDQVVIHTEHFHRSLDTTIGVAHKCGTNILQKSELALTEAKHSGKNQVQFYRDDLKIIKRIENTNYWGQRIKEAFSLNNILPYYQPIYDTQTQELYKYEMLVRLRYNDKIYTPNYFLEAAENNGQLFDIFRFMFKRACSDSAKTGHNFSINIGNVSLHNPKLLHFVEKVLKDDAVNASLITLEILENNSVSDEPCVRKKVAKLSDLGLEIVIDDFGTRCSNFSQLEDLGATMLKIDGKYIKNLDTSKESQIIVSTIQHYAHEKGMKLVAEFVHSKEIYEIVKKLGIDYVQGYYLGEPTEHIL